MRIEFNPDKDATNQAKHHGLSLALPKRFDWLTAQVTPARTVSGERRWKMVVALESIVYTVIFTYRADDVFWIISLRHASRKERRNYEG